MKDWLKNLFATIDRKDADGFVELLTADARFRFGSAEAVCGREAVRAAVAGFFSTVEGLSHSVTQVWEEAGVVLTEGDVTYTLGEGRELTLPFLNVFRMDGELVADYRIYIDPSPLAG